MNQVFEQVTIHQNHLLMRVSCCLLPAKPTPSIARSYPHVGRDKGYVEACHLDHFQRVSIQLHATVDGPPSKRCHNQSETIQARSPRVTSVATVVRTRQEHRCRHVQERKHRQSVYALLTGHTSRCKGITPVQCECGNSSAFWTRSKYPNNVASKNLRE